MRTWNMFWNDETAAIVSIEMVLIVTIAVLALIVGLSEVAVAVNTELNDISNAVGNLDQSYGYSGFSSGSWNKLKSYYGGGRFNDSADDCDKNTSCDLVCGVSQNDGECRGAHHN